MIRKMNQRFIFSCFSATMLFTSHFREKLLIEIMLKIERCSIVNFVTEGQVLRLRINVY